jgi:hypothetical protein
MLCFRAGPDPWCGVLVCTERAHQPSLCAEFPELAPHPILPKWLYLRETTDRFETIAAQLVRLARNRDARLGVETTSKKRTRTAKSSRNFRP